MAEPAARLRPNLAELTVSELAGAIKGTLEDRFGYVRLRGEISGYRGPHASGHCYFALKDDRAKIEAVIWRGNFQRLRFKPAEGLEVVAHGKITTYPGSSKYQIVIETMEPAGVGALMALLEERKKALAAEGLFDAARKRQLPFLPRVVGIVTSPTGAVIRDMLFGFDERFPTRVVVWPVRVQGETSAAEVAAAIRGFNAMPADGPLPRPDLIIVARGGGSLEDLWGFNEEVVVRAAADSLIPLISAVGHETDWTLIDLAADARAPTPTKAAEWAVPNHADLIDQCAKFELRLGVAARKLVQARRVELKSVARGLPRPEDLVALPRQRFDAVQMRLGRALLANTRAHATRAARVGGRLNRGLLDNRLARARDRLDIAGRRGREALSQLAGQRRSRLERVSGRLSPAVARQRLVIGADRLQAVSQRVKRALETLIRAERRRLGAQAQMLAALSYQSVLQRGFALVRTADGRALRATADVVPGDRLQIEIHDGSIEATVAAASARDGRSPPERERRPPPVTSVAPILPAPRRSGRHGDAGSDGGPQGSLF